MTDQPESAPGSGFESRPELETGLSGRIRSAILWRSGSQIVAQLVAWSSTVFVIRLLSPRDYGLMAMSTSVVSLACLLNGYSFAGALVQSDAFERMRACQVFGMLIVMNGGLALAQVLVAPLAAAYFHQPLVAPMLRVQALIHLTTPFIIMPNALLSRSIDFRIQARANLIAGPLAAATAITGAALGWGVWALVAAPLVLLGSRAAGLMVMGRWWLAPSFRWHGAGAVFGFGGAMLASDLFWFVQSQADVFIAGRRLDPHHLGLYSTALFLAQILVNKFVPALNEVAFPGYARLKGGGGAVGPAFLRALGTVMLVALPWSLGLAAVARPLVLVVLGARWDAAAVPVALLALAMPFVTLHILFAPAVNAIGRPGVSARIAGAGAAIMPAAFLVGSRWGANGLAASWLAGYPLLALVAARLSLPVLEIGWAALARALAPALLPAILMAAVVVAIDAHLGAQPPAMRLLLLVPAGAASYAAGLALVGRAAVLDLLAMVRPRRGQISSAAMA